MQNKKVILTIIDGWGIAPKTPYNAIANANTPNFDRLIREYPNTSLKSDGESVGLPEGQFGTSEVNHLTIGSGRIIWQDLPKINREISSGSFFDNAELLKSVNHVVKNNSKLHLIGILSDGGVHSHINHLLALIDLLEQKKFKQKVYLHLFTDGRDVAPKSAEKYFSILEKKMSESSLDIKISTIQGRSFLDRDRDWARTEIAFKLMKDGEGIKVSSPQAMINLAYNTYSSDEYFPQYLLDENGLLKDKDGVIVFHYRTDRVYQIVRRILDEKFKNFSITTFIQISEEFSEVNVAFPRNKVEGTLAETIATADKSQMHIAETEKFPHVTFFFNGEKEKEMSNEQWKLFESNRFIKPMYNFEPSMRNFEIAKTIIDGIKSSSHDFFIANLSSPDMVGHTGNYNAAIISAESIDYCLGKIYDAIKDKLDEFAWIITADHGNSEIMWDEVNNQPHTQHTLSKVPFIVVSDIPMKLARRESLEDIAPTILDLLGVDKSPFMTGTTLIEKI